MKIRNSYLIFFVIGITIMVILTLGCSKDFLEVPAQGRQTPEEVKKDPNAANDLVIGVYNSLYFGGFGNTTVGLLYTLTVDVASDDSDKGSTAGDQQQTAGKIDNFTVDANVSYLNNLWAGHYTAIARANQALQVLSESTFDETTKNRLIGETRFLRGFYYFNLVRLFGGVPLILKVPTSDDVKNSSDEFVVKKPVDSVYNAIIADLQFAIDNLPLRGEAGSIEGRVNKGTAQAYLAKVYLYQQNYPKAYELSTAAITSGKFSLVPYPYYAQVFREASANGAGGVNNSESIFEMQSSNNISCNAISELYSNGQGPRATKGWANTVNNVTYNGDLGFGFNCPSESLVNAYEPGDTRKDGTIIFVQPTGGANTGTVLWDGFRIPTQDSVQNSRYNYKAYHSPFKESASCNGTDDKDHKPKNIRLMRYAEVLLINAEAALQTGNTGDAVTAMHLIRSRAGLPDFSSVTIDSVWKEHRVELAMECDRFFDLVRTGRAATVLGPLGFTPGKNEVFPIPQPQIDLSGGKLKQNPGYN